MLFGWHGSDGEQNRQPIGQPIGSQRSSLMYQTDTLGSPATAVAGTSDISVAASECPASFMNRLGKPGHPVERMTESAKSEARQRLAA